MFKKTHVNYDRRKEPLLHLMLKDFSRGQLLSREEEVSLSLRIAQGDEQAEDLLIKSNLPFVLYTASDYLRYGLSFSDLILAGTVGLIKAAKKFDGSRGTKFISYAVWYIKQEMQTAVRNDATVKLPINKQSTLRKINKAICALQQELFRDPITAEIADYLKIDERTVLDCLNYRRRVYSISDEQYYNRFTNTLSDPEADLRYQLDEHSDKISYLSWVNSLPKRLALVVTLFFGIADVPSAKLEEIAQIMGLSKERVRQLKALAIKELRRRGWGYLAYRGIFG